MSKQHCRMLQVERFFRQSRMLLRHCCWRGRGLKLKGCIVWNNTIQYSPEAVCYPCTSCLLPAFDYAYCYVPAPEWCQRYLPRYLFSVSNSVCFLPCIGRQAAPALRRTIGFNMQYRTSDVAENLGRYVSPVRSVQSMGKTLNWF